MTRTFLSTLLMLLPPAVGMAQVEFIKTPVRADACVNDLFFVDVPLEADINDIPPNFEQDLQADLTALARANVGWFCDHNTCDPLRAPGRLVARVARLLPQREQSRLDERFLRIGFYYLPKPGRMANAQRLRVRDAAVCSAVTALNATVGALWPDDAQPPYIGRACIASGQLGPLRPPQLRPGTDLSGLLPTISDEMLNWHLNQMSVDEAIPAKTPIVLVDTGVQDHLVSEVRRWNVPDPVLPARYDAHGRPLIEQRDATHPHGTEMALAMRQITTAPIIDLPALGAGGRVPLGQVARAVDAAATRIGNTSAVINLSLGWAPEIERLRKLRRGFCATTESPAGEAMRAVLASVRQRFPQQLVVTAGGNRARLGESYMLTFAGRNEAIALNGATEEDAFYPGHWGLRPTNGEATVLTVGAIQSSGRLAAMDQGQAALYAPGQHVYVDADTDPVENQCAPGRRALQLPRAVTGSSIAAAFTSAAAARIWDLQPETSAARAARLLYLAAEPMGIERKGRLSYHKSFAGTLARRLNLKRLDDLLRAPSHALANCMGGQSAASTGPTVSWRCRRALERLGFDERLRPESPPVVWPRPRAQHCGPDVGDDPPRLTLPQPSPTPLCLDADTAFVCETDDLYSAGDAGPQPEDIGGCDDCMLFQRPDGTLRMQGQLNPRLPDGTRISFPYLIARWPNGSKSFVSLSGAQQTWGPGVSINIPNIHMNSGFYSISSADLYLHTRIKTPKQTKGIADLSPVRVGN